MFLKKNSNGIYYIVFEQMSGKRTSVSTKKRTKGEAQKEFTRFKRDFLEKEETIIPITIKQYQFHYFRHIEPIYTKKTMQGVKTTFNHFLKHFGNRNLSQISRLEMEEYLLLRLKNISPYSAKRDLANLSCAFKRAVSEKYLKSNPCEGIKTFKIPEKLPIYYSKEDFNKLLSVITDDDIKDLVIFAVNTGLRQMELLTLNWNQVNLEQRFLVLDNQGYLTKTKRPRNVPLNNQAYEILKQRKNRKISEQIFTYQGKSISQDFITHKFKKYIHKATINPKLNFHSLRHTFASWLVQKGAPIYQVSKLLGHSNLSTTEIYSHLRRDDLLQTANLLNDDDKEPDKS